jgi:hypothetical protein
MITLNVFWMFGAIAVLALMPAISGAKTFTTASGVVVPTPEPGGLDCAQMRGVLDAIDASGYRRGGPAPANAADSALLGYENRLSESFYMRCVYAPAAGPMPVNAFDRGYQSGVK